MKRKKSCLSLLVAVAMTAATVLSPLQSVLAAGPDTYSLEGDGSPASPYILQSEQDLLYVTEQMNAGNGDYVGKAYELNGDIQMTETFPMIDDFSGSLDGNGYAIKDLVINGTLPDTNKGNYRAGFIRRNTGAIEDLCLEDITVTCVGDNGTAGGPTAGGLVAENTGSITRCSVTGSISAPTYEMAAGIAGKNGNNNSIISDCSFSGDVTAMYMAGGIAGYAKGTVERCFARGDMTTTSDHPTDGRNNQQGNDAAIVCAYPGNPLTVRNNVAAGGTITMAFPDYQIDGFVGRVVGFTGNSVKINNNYGSTEIRIKNQTVTSEDVNSQHGLDKTDAELKAQATYEELGWDFETVWEMDAETGYPTLQKPEEETGVTALTGDGSSSNPFLINNEAEFLFWIEQMNNQNGVYYNEKQFALTNDITLTDEIAMVRSFNGVFDGRGHTISGLKLRGAVPDTNKGDYRAALILENTGAIQDLTLADVDIVCTGDNGNTAGPACAALVADNLSGGVVQRCAVTGSVSAPGFEKVAGIVAQNKGGSVLDCYFEGELTGKFMGGGIVAYNNSNSSIQRCFADADLTLTGTEQVTGKNSQQGNDGAMICAYPNTAYIQGNVAYGGSITYAYNQPGAKTEGYYGRIIGCNDFGKTLRDNIANEAITINGETVDGTYTDPNGQNVTLEQLQQQSTYEDLGWDFDYTWKMDEEKQHPVLQYVDSSTRPDRITVTFNGDSETQKAFTWFTSVAVEEPVVRISETKSFDEVIEVAATQQELYGDAQYQALATNLTPNTTYYYQVGDKATGIFSGTGEFVTAKDSGAFSFINITDTQSYTDGDAQVSANTLQKALATVPDAAFVLHGGDVVDDGSNESMWTSLLNYSAAGLTSTTIAPAAGNHEATGNAFINHFNLELNGNTTGGTYYSFDYSNAHFVVLNTNEDSTQNLTQEQLDWLREDVTTARANGADWIILNMHKGPYTTANHLDDQDIKNMRRVIVPLIDELDIDLVLQGHDHILARTKVLAYDENGTECAAPVETTKITEMKGGKRIEYAVSPEGTIYFLANTAGVKHYDQESSPSGIDMEEYLELFDRSEQGVQNNTSEKNAQYFAGITIDGGKLEAMVYQIKDQSVPYSWEGFGIDKEIEPMIQQIEDLPEAGDLTLADKTAVTEARMAYNDLSEAQQGAITNYDKLKELEYRLVELESDNGQISPWFDDTALSRQVISVRNDENEAFYNAPVLLKLTDIPAGAGEDTLKFYTMSGLSIPYEIENWNPDGVTSVWVKLEELPANGAANLWVYYGGEKAQNDPTEVWNATYELVEHFTQDSAAGDTRVDSTGKQTGTVEGNGLTATAGQDGTMTSYFNNTKIVYGDVGGGMDQVSVSAIYQATAEDLQNQPEDNAPFFAKDVAGSGSNDTLFLGVNKTDKQLVSRYSGLWYESSSTSPKTTESKLALPEDGKPHLVTMSYDGMTVAVFIDGEKQYEAFAEYRTTLNDDKTPSTIGAYSNTGEVKASYRGTLDEIQLTGYRTTPEWEAFRYNNYFGDAVSYGAVEDKADTGVTLHISYPMDNASAQTGMVKVTGVVSKASDLTAAVDGKTFDLGTSEAGEFSVLVPVDALNEQTITLTAAAQDESGEAEDSVTLMLSDSTAPNMPVLSDSSKDGVVTGDSATLKADITSDYNEEVSVQFYQNQAIALSDQNTVVRYGTTDERLPDSIAPTDGEQSDSLFGTATGEGENPYQIYEITLTEAQKQAKNFHLVWNGSAEREVTAYVYNTSVNGWQEVGSAYDQDAPSVSIDMNIPNENVVKDGKLTLLLWRGMTEAIENRETYKPEEGQFDFGMVVVPDTQLYTQSYPEKISEQFQWIVDTAKENKTEMVLHVGDVVNRPYLNQEFQWQAASAAFSLLEQAGIPYGIAWGNHDYDNGTNSRIRYNQYFPVTRLQESAGDLWGGSFGIDADKPIDDAYYLLEEHGTKLLVMSISYWQTNEDLDWAAKVIEEHPDYSVIIFTHNYTNLNDISNTDMLNKVVKNHSNVKLVLSGHVAGTNVVYSNFGDHETYNVLADYQGLSYGGQEFIRSVQFDLENDLIYFNTYSPMTGETTSPYGNGTYSGNRGNLYQVNKDEFAIRLDLGGTSTRTLTTNSLTLAAGENAAVGEAQTVTGTGSASVVMNGLQADTDYEWFVTVTDKAGNVTTSAPLTFTVEAAPEHTHTLVKTEATEATCVKDGNIEYWTCSECGKLFSDEAATQEITLEDTVLPATGEHTPDGSGWHSDETGHWQVCSQCGEKLNEQAHTGGTATCCDKAVCTVCGSEYGELNPDNHAGGTEIRNEKPATEDEEGYTGDTYCLGCGEMLSQGETVEKLPHTHTLVKTEAKKATAEEDGNIEYWTCSECGKLFSDEAATQEITLEDTVIPATGTPGDNEQPGDSDSSGDGDNTQNPDHEQPGSQTPDAQDPSSQQPDDDASVPQTGDMPLAMLAVLAAGSCAALLVSRKQRKAK